jgi:hypothetical protein
LLTSVFLICLFHTYQRTKYSKSISQWLLPQSSHTKHSQTVGCKCNIFEKKKSYVLREIHTNQYNCTCAKHEYVQKRYCWDIVYVDKHILRIYTIVFLLSSGLHLIQSGSPLGLSSLYNHIDCPEDSKYSCFTYIQEWNDCFSFSFFCVE